MTFEHVIPHVYNKYRNGGTVRKKFDIGGHATNAASDAAKYGLLGGILTKNKWVGLGAGLFGLGAGALRRTKKEEEEAQQKANFLAAQNSTAENADPVQLGASRGTAHAIDNSSPYAQGAAQATAPRQASAMTNPVPNIQSYKMPAVMKRGGKIKSSRDILKELLKRKNEDGQQ